MASYAELLQTCTEFQENFSILSGKYSAVTQELENEKDRSAQLRRKLEESTKREERSEELVRTLRRDLEAANAYREKLATATVALEQMKGRAQHTRRGVADALAEHDQEVEQLKGQIKDLLQRIDLAADSTRVNELNKQVAELEGRAAAANAALREEKEKFSQQLLVAHNALREQQARNLELEQRYRAIDGEVTEMRAAMRRSAELQNDAAMLKERHATEAAVARREANGLREELEQVRVQMAEQRQQTEEAVVKAQRASAEERATARGRIAALTSSLSSATAEAEAERRRCRELQRSTQQQVDEARDEATVELTAVRRALTEAKEETQRLQHRCDRLRADLEAAQRAGQQQHAALDALQAQLDTASRQLASSVQQEAWLTAERAHAGEQLAAAEQRLEELTAALQQREQTALDLERTHLRVEMLEAELQDARRATREMAGRAQDVEEAATQRLQRLRQEMKACHKQVKLEKDANHALRKRLLLAVSEHEASFYAAARSGESMQPATLPRGSGLPNNSPMCDTIGLLKRQNEDAARLHSRVMELSH